MRKYTLAAVILTAVVLAARLLLDIEWSVGHGKGVFFGPLKFITAFTTLSNFFVGIVMLASLVDSKSAIRRFFTSPTVAGCAAVYIIITVGVYNLLLAHVENPQGFERVVSGFLHAIVPATYLGFWYMYAPKRKLRPRHAVIWPIGAVGYFIVILIRGAMTGEYPYPFVDVDALGYARVMLNAMLLLAVFVAIGLLLVATGRWAPSKGFKTES